MSILRLSFLDLNNTEHILRYKIYDTGLARRWISVIEENKSFPEKYIHSTFANRTIESIPEIHDSLIKTIKLINIDYHTPISLYEDITVFNYDHLNELHHIFEEYDEYVPRLPSDELLDDTVHYNFLKFNELIHMYENALDSSKFIFPSMSAVFDYYPQTIRRPILERDKIYIRLNHKWGELYLGYNTLGKDWLTASSDNDIDLVKRQEVRPQQQFAAEMWLNFTRDCDTISKTMLFESWYESLDEDLQKTIPIDNLNELGLGKFLIGELIIDDYFLKFDSNINNWIVPRSNTKIRWNKEVFSTFRELKYLEIINND
jgi:hypothetical protein